MSYKDIEIKRLYQKIKGVIKIKNRINISFKTGIRDEDGVEHLKTKNITLPISIGGTTIKELTININKESNLEEETITVKEIEGNL
ncbi:hypothetical protein CWI37_0329p0010 [Hamiltosporidium tvaerminnensis]|uniref:Uncharacterized protein n=1 Tax=Hamiltosporidium tvaerminnensis TaxID=1176355 RepID=A0A4Q9L7N2_9MICR|nr:hypothetical protein CWI37_0329p0010 [Hamiltosporidium tvaerminnensis]